MASEQKDPELDRFLKQVDEIGSLVKELSSTSTTETAGVVKKVDKYLEKSTAKCDNTGVNRTVINKNAFNAEGHHWQQNPDSMSQEGFMAVMEQDAKERSERRRQREKEANTLKEKGNEEFREGHYEAAVDLYTQALEKVRDMTALYTNRAQAYNKLGQFEKAIEDCDWALKIFENCLKAHIHKGKAYLGLKRYAEALESFHKAQQVDPKKEKLINEYIREVQSSQETDRQEQAARELFNSGDQTAVGVVDLLDRVSKEGQLPLYYSGGMRVLRESLDDNVKRTLFRSHGGIQITETHPLISRCFCASPRSLSKDELDMCSATLETLAAACRENEENQKQLLDIPNFPNQLLRLLETKVKHSQTIKTSAIKLLHEISQTQLGRSAIVAKFDQLRVVSCLFTLMEKSSPVAEHSSSLLNNLALDARFKQQFRGTINEDILPSFETLMMQQGTNEAILPSCISTVTNLSADGVIRGKIARRKETWEACCQILESYLPKLDKAPSLAIINSTLGLLANLSVEQSQNSVDFAARLAKVSSRILASQTPSLQERNFILVGRLLIRCPEAVAGFCEDGSVSILLNIIKIGDSDLVKPALKCLTACTQYSESARKEIVLGKGLQTISNLVKNSDEVTVGNAALCLSHCCQLSDVAATMVQTDIVKDLLVMARDAKQHDVQHNCGILLAKLCQSDARHLERLRELHGIEILHTVMNNKLS